MEKIDSRLLESEMVKKGISVKDISEKLEIADTTFYRKISGSSDFYRHEIAKIVEVLKLSRSITDLIFFKDVFA